MPVAVSHWKRSTPPGGAGQAARVSVPVPVVDVPQTIVSPLSMRSLQNSSAVRAIKKRPQALLLSDSGELGQRALAVCVHQSGTRPTTIGAGRGSSRTIAATSSGQIAGAVGLAATGR